MQTYQGFRVLRVWTLVWHAFWLTNHSLSPDLLLQGWAAQHEAMAEVDKLSLHHHQRESSMEAHNGSNSEHACLDIERSKRCGALHLLVSTIAVVCLTLSKQNKLLMPKPIQCLSCNGTVTWYCYWIWNTSAWWTHHGDGALVHSRRFIQQGSKVKVKLYTFQRSWQEPPKAAARNFAQQSPWDSWGPARGSIQYLTVIQQVNVVCGSCCQSDKFVYDRSIGVSDLPETALFPASRISSYIC